MDLPDQEITIGFANQNRAPGGALTRIELHCHIRNSESHTRVCHAGRDELSGRVYLLWCEGIMGKTRENWHFLLLLILSDTRFGFKVQLNFDTAI
jgi:hypothetical protein